jgi:RNA polymerase sigma factor (sigma-70 family)
MSRQRRRAGRSDGSPIVVEVPGDDQRVADADELAHALERLSSRQQQVVMWRYYFDQSVEETAGRMGLTPSKVKDATHEAVTKLARTIKSERSGAA